MIGFRGSVLAAGFLMWAASSVAQPTVSPLAVTGGWTPDQWLRQDQAIELRLNRLPLSGEERVAVLIGPTDWTALFVTDGMTVRYTPGSVRLAGGQHDVVVSVVAGTGEWKEIGRLPLRVLTAGGFEQVKAAPRAELGFNRLLAQDEAASAGAPAERPLDITMTLGLQSESIRAGWATRTNVNVTGVSIQGNALRFGQLGPEAPALDLADYLVELANGRTKLGLGHVSPAGHRYLFSVQDCSSSRCAPTFSSRGATAVVALGPFTDLSLAAVNGSPIVGWSNVFGLQTRDHRILNATLGVEAKPARPGALRIEASILDGSVLPLAGFTQGVVNDAEKSRGLGVRVGATDAQGRFWLDAGYSRSRFQNPADALLQRRLSIVPVQEEGRGARYLDTSYALVHNKPIGKSATASIVAGYRYERADPLYRSVGAPTARADILQHVVETTASVGSFTARVAKAWSHDNLDAIASILETQTDTTSLDVVVPLSTLGRDPSQPQPRLPAITYQLARTHQFGVVTPINAGFGDPSQIPDQASTTHAIGLEWQLAKWRAGYAFNRSFQDNRQIGRDLADLVNLTNQVTLGVTPHEQFDITADAGFDGAENFEISRIDVTRRLGLTTNWRPTAKTAVTGLVSFTWMHDQAGTSENRSTDFNVQVSQGIALWPAKPNRLQGQVFVRASRRSGATFDRVFGLASDTRAWTVNTGLSLRVF
jgi:hypothetical protein